MYKRIFLASSYLLGISLTAAANDGFASIWEYTHTKDGKQLTLAAEHCFSDSDKRNISVIWYPETNNYNRVVRLSCNCGENLKLNSEQIISVESLEDLLKNGVSTNLTSYQCLPAKAEK